jgi:bifunctional enzyme CysN/CysC
MLTKQLSTEEADNAKQLSTAEAVSLRLVIAGHVDHGKSTIIGRLLADTDLLPEGKLRRVKETCRRNAKPFEYAFLLDALKDEQAQGITIDAARCFFKTGKRNYLIMDAPGHVEFVKNMVTGAARAEAALLVIDAFEGIQENSRRHGYLLAMLGIRQITILVNKMDLVDYSQTVFNEIVAAYGTFLAEIGIQTAHYIPVSGLGGDNIVVPSVRTPWYQGPTVLAELDLFQAEGLPAEKPLRLPVQGVYKFTDNSDRRRIVAGTIASGQLWAGDDVVFYPSGKRSKVKSLETFPPTVPQCFTAGQAVGFTLNEQIYVKRGELATLASQTRPQVTSRLRCNLFWLGKKSLVLDQKYSLKLGSAKVKMRVEAITRVLDAATLNTTVKAEVARYEVAECILQLEEAMAFDLMRDNFVTSRFVIVADYEIAGGGIVTEALPDGQPAVREEGVRCNLKWGKSMIAPEERTAKYQQPAALVLLTGVKDIGNKPLGKALERQLFNAGRIVYFLGSGNVLYGADAGLKKAGREGRENYLRRLAEVAYLMLDAGLILIVTALELTRAELDKIKTISETGQILTIWVGETVTTDLNYDLQIPTVANLADSIGMIQEQLQKRRII